VRLSAAGTPSGTAAGAEPRPARARRRVVVELRTPTSPFPEEELRRREQELERLIVKAACRRAARLAGQLGDGPTAAGRGATPPGGAGSDGADRE
jgi:hypothetical protein